MTRFKLSVEQMNDGWDADIVFEDGDLFREAHFSGQTLKHVVAKSKAYFNYLDRLANQPISAEDM